MDDNGTPINTTTAQDDRSAAGETYHGRWSDAAAQGQRVRVVVPVDGARVPFVAGSGVVAGEVDDEGRRTVHFEGWVHGACQYESLDARGRWEAAVLHAAGRQVSRYPTAAMCSVRAEELVDIGWFDVASATVQVDDEAALGTWLGQ